MKKIRTNSKATLTPYFIIFLAATLAYLPVSTMLFTLKNDVIAIEYPIQHYISECLRNGEFPAWFNTWSMGFPLQSVLTWGVYSTPAMLIGTLFKSNIYVLHGEFLFFIMAAGWCMFKLLKTHFMQDRNLALLLACCYMLSGFTVGSSQWLLYITGMTFIPLVLYCLLSLIQTPSLKYAFLLSVSYYLLLTNVHIYLTLTFTYIFLTLLILHIVPLLFRNNINRHIKFTHLKFISLSGILTLILCAAPVYYTFETVSYLERSQPISADLVFFRSNYLHPDGLSSLLLPLSSIKTSYSNTEGTVLNTYIGLLPLLLLPLSFKNNLNQKNNTAGFLLLFSLLFLIISFGHLTPLREWLNILPGMSYFRHPGILRVFFILGIILYIASSFKNISLVNLLKSNTSARKIIIISTTALALVSLIVLIIYLPYKGNIWKGSFYQTLKTIGKNELILISSLIQLMVSLLLLLIYQKRVQLFSYIIIAELIINTLICTPFFTVSTYSVKEVNRLLQSPEKFPIQQSPPFDVPGTLSDTRHNSWPNINTYKKEVSANLSMPGPLILKKVSVFLVNDPFKKSLSTKQLIYINGNYNHLKDSIKITEQQPSTVSAEITLSQPQEIILQQASFPGWKVLYNGLPLTLLKTELPFVTVKVPAGKGKLIFQFKKPVVIYTSIILHIIVLLTFFFWLIPKILRLFSPS